MFWTEIRKIMYTPVISQWKTCNGHANVMFADDLTRVTISYEIYETSLRPVTYMSYDDHELRFGLSYDS